MGEELLSWSQYVTNWPFPRFGAIYDAYGAVVGCEVEIHGRSASVIDSTYGIHPLKARNLIGQCMDP